MTMTQRCVGAWRPGTPLQRAFDTPATSSRQVWRTPDATGEPEIGPPLRRELLRSPIDRLAMRPDFPHDLCSRPSLSRSAVRSRF
jgi:hypothetical protein